MNRWKWILSLGMSVAVLSACSEKSTKGGSDGADCSSAPLTSYECLEGVWTMDPSRNAQAIALLAADPAYAGRNLPLAIESGEASITLEFTEEGRVIHVYRINLVNNLPEYDDYGNFGVVGEGSQLNFFQFNNLEISKVVDAKIIQDAEGYYLVIPEPIFSLSPSAQAAEVYYRSLSN